MSFIETHKIEFKKILNDKFEKEVVAFLNADGGDLYIGVDDKGNFIGVDNITKVSEQCTCKIIDGISPSVVGLFTNKILTKNDKQYILISLSSGVQKPYYIKKYGMSPKGCYVRKGATSIPMHQSDIDNLYKNRINCNIQSRKSPIQNLSFQQLKIFYEEKGKDTGQYFLQNLGFYTEDHTFNYLAYLFSDNSNISIKIAKFNGKDKIDLSSSDDYGFCSLIKTCYNVLNRLNIENINTATITAKVREDKRLINEIALREAAINAIVHNDYMNTSVPAFFFYSDRLEIESGGGLPYGLTENEFYSGKSIPRNPGIIRIFKDLGYVEQLGSGIQRILSVYSKDIFKITDNFVNVIFKYDKVAMRKLNIKSEENLIDHREINTIESKKQIIREAISNNSKISTEKLANICHISVRTVKKYMKSMEDIEFIGSGYSGHWEIKK